MSAEISERAFEDAIECGLLQYGPDACAADVTAVRETSQPYGESPPGGYRKRRPEEYDRALCLLPRDVADFVLATQPKDWKKLEQHHGAAVKEQFLKRLAAEIERRGALDVLRNGIKDSGCKFRLAYFRPASGLSEETRRLHAASLFSVVRQLRYSTRNENCLDLVLFLNGIPSSPPSSRIRTTLRTSRTRSASTRPTATRASRSWPTAAASRTSRWTRISSTSRRTSREPGPGSSPSTRRSSAAPATRPCRPPASAMRRATCGTRRGHATACSISCASSSTRSRKRTTRARRPVGASSSSRATSSSTACVGS